MISFSVQSDAFTYPSPHQAAEWIDQLISQYQYHTGSILFVFCTDDELLAINRQFLQHDYFTDVITFDLSEHQEEISGEIYLSIDRIRDNSQTLNIPLMQEIHRVMAHGVLHLMGFGDKSPRERQEMEEAENDALRLFASSTNNEE